MAKSFFPSIIRFYSILMLEDSRYIEGTQLFDEFQLLSREKNVLKLKSYLPFVN
jgi:hypothetical protein